MPIALVLPFWNILSSHVLKYISTISLLSSISPLTFKPSPRGPGKTTLKRRDLRQISVRLDVILLRTTLYRS
jgi:hypothetical protein